MKSILAATAMLVLVAGCSQPADEPENTAVDTTPMTDTGQADGANSFTEGQAKGAIEGAGYTNVTGLMKDDQGIWRGTGTKDGATAQVSVDYRGAVTTGEGASAAPAGTSSMNAETKEN